MVPFILAVTNLLRCQAYTTHPTLALAMVTALRLLVFLRARLTSNFSSFLLSTPQELTTCSATAQSPTYKGNLALAAFRHRALHVPEAWNPSTEATCSSRSPGTQMQPLQETTIEERRTNKEGPLPTMLENPPDKAISVTGRPHQGRVPESWGLTLVAPTFAFPFISGSLPRNEKSSLI